MADINRRINYEIGFSVNKANINQIKEAVKEINNINTRDYANRNNLNYDKASAEMAKIRKDANALEEALQRAYNQKFNTVNIKEFNSELKKSNTDLTSVVTSLAKTGAVGQNAIRNLVSQTMNVNVKLKETSNVLNKIGETLSNTLKWNLASGAVNTLQGTIQQAYGYAKNLDSSLNDIRIVTGKSADEMERFAEKANKTAKDLKSGTTDYTRAALIYYQQGLSDEEVAARTDVTLKTANVTQQSTEEVSEQLTAIWNGYKVAAEEAESYIDKTAAVAASTASDLQELATGMSKVASAANIMGVDIDQLNAQIATTVSVTRQAPESVGTAYKTIYARMGDIKAGKDEEVSLGSYTSKMADMGFNVLDETNQLRDMGEVIEEVGNKWSDLTREQQISLAQIMAGTRQYNNLLSLFDNWDMYLSALETSRNAVGTLQEQQDIYAESTQAHLQELTTSLEGVYDSIITAEDINSVVDAITPVVTVIEQIVDGLGGGVEVLKEFSPLMLQALGPQIAQSTNSIITNISNAKFNKEQINALPETANSLKKIISDSNSQLGEGQQVENITKSVVELTEKYNKLGLAMNSKDFETGQAYLQNYIEAINQLNTSLQKAKNQLQQLTAAQGSEGVRIGVTNKQNYMGLEKVDLTSEKNLLLINDDSIQKIQDQLSRASNEIAGAGSKDIVQSILEKYNLQITEGLDEADADLEAFKEKVRNALGEISDNWEQNGDVIEENGGEYSTNAWKMANATEDLQEHFNKISRLNLVEFFTNSASAVFGLYQAITDLQSLGSIWDNEDLTTSEKVTQTITIMIAAMSQLGIATKALNEVFKNRNAIQLKNTGLTGLQAAANEAETETEKKNAEAMKKSADAAENLTKKETEEAAASAGQAAANVAESGTEQGGSTGKKSGEEVKNLLSILGKVPTTIKVIAALITAAVLVVSIALKEFEKQAQAAKKRAEEAAETAKQLGAAYKEAEEKLNSLNDSLNNYDTIQKELQELTQGTEEWNEKLRESNEQVLELLKNYPSIATKIDRNSNGQLVLTDEARDSLIEKQEEEVASAYRAKLSADIQEIQAQEIADKVEIKQEIFGEVKFTDFSDWDFSTDDLDKLISIVEKQGSQVLEVSDQQALNILKEAGFTEDQIKAIQDNSDKVMEAVQTIENNRLSIDLLTQEISKLDFNDEDVSAEEAYFAEQFASTNSLYAKKSNESSIDALKRIGILKSNNTFLNNDYSKFLQEYLESSGYSVDFNRNKNAISKIKDENGTEIKAAELNKLLEEVATAYLSEREQKDRESNKETYLKESRDFIDNNALLADYLFQGRNFSETTITPQEEDSLSKYLGKLESLAKDETAIANAYSLLYNKNDINREAREQYRQDMLQGNLSANIPLIDINEQNIVELKKKYDEILDYFNENGTALKENVNSSEITDAMKELLTIAAGTSEGIDNYRAFYDVASMSQGGDHVYNIYKDLKEYFGELDNFNAGAYIRGTYNDAFDFINATGADYSNFSSAVGEIKTDLENIKQGMTDLAVSGRSVSEDEAYNQALNIFGGSTALTFDQQVALHDKIQEVVDQGGQDGIDAFIESLKKDNFEVALNFTYNKEEIEDGISESLKDKMKDLKVSEEDFYDQRELFQMEGKNYSNEAIVNYLAAQKDIQKIQSEYEKNVQEIAKDSSKENYFDTLKKDFSEMTTEERQSIQTLKSAMDSLFGTSVSYEWIQQNLDLIEAFIVKGEDMTAFLTEAKKEMLSIDRDYQAEINNIVSTDTTKVGQIASENFTSNLEEIAQSLELNQEGTRALFQQYGYYWSEEENAYIYQGNLEDYYTYNTKGERISKKISNDDLKEIFGKNLSDKQLEKKATDAGFIKQSDGTWQRTTELEEKFKLTPVEDETVAQSSTLDELLKKFNLDFSIAALNMFKKAGWVFDENGNATRTIDAVIENGSTEVSYDFSSTEEAIKKLGEGFKEALATGGAHIVTNEDGTVTAKFYAEVDAAIGEQGKVNTEVDAAIGEQGKVNTEEDTSTEKKDVTDKFQDINDQISKYSSQLSHLQKLEKGLVGTALAENIQQQNKVREKQIELIKSKIELTKTELAQQRELLKSSGISFDADGYITNAATVLKSLENTDAYDTLSTSISNYRSLLESLPDLEDSLIIETPEVDPLFEVNTLIDEYNNKLQRLQNTEENFSGKGLIDNLKQQVELYQQLIETQNSMYAIRAQTLDQQRAVLSSFGINFEADGKLKTEDSQDENGNKIAGLQTRLNEIANSDDLVLKESYDRVLSLLEEYISNYQSTIELLWDIEDNAEQQGEALAKSDLVEVQTAADKAKKDLDKLNKSYEKVGKETERAEGFTIKHAQAVKEEEDALGGLIQKQEEYISKLKEEQKLLSENEQKNFNKKLSDLGIANVSLSLEDNGFSNEEEVRNAISEKINEKEKEIQQLQDKISSGQFSKEDEERLNNLKEQLFTLSEMQGSLNIIASNWQEISDSIDTATDSLSSYKDEASAADLLKDDLNVYYEVDNELKEISDELSQLKGAQSNLEGDALIANLNQQKNLIDKQISAQKEKIKLAQQELKNRQLELETILKIYLLEKGIVATFDEKTGKVTNYNEILTAASGLSEASYNEIKNAMDLVNTNAEQLKEFNNSLKSLDNDKASIDKSIKEAIKKQKEKAKKELEKKVKWFNLQVDVELDISDAERRLNDLKKKIEGLNDNDILGNAQKNFENYQSYFKGNIGSYFGAGDTGSITGLTSHLNAIMSEIHIMQGGGMSNLYGTDQESAFEDLYKYRDSLLSQLEAVQQLKEEIKKAYTEMLNKFADKVNDILEGYKQINDIIDHNINLIKLTQGENAFTSIGNWYGQKIENDKQTLAQAKKEADYWKKAMASAQKGSEEWEKYYEEYTSAISDLNSLLESSIQDALDQYNNLISKAMAELNAKLSGGYNLDYLDEDWEHATDMADRYLDKLNKAYEVTTLRNKVDKSLSDLDDLAAQKKLRDVMDEQLKILESKEYLTQYDVDRANKIYELTLKQIALEEAQNNKSKMRLRRDSQGNYRYEYVADSDDIADKQQELLDAQNDLYNFDKERYVSVLEDANQAYRDYTSKRIEILNSTAYTEEEKIYLLDELDKNFRESQLGRLEDLQTAEMNTMQSANDLSQKLLEEQVNNLADLIPQAGSTTAEFVHNILDGEGGINSSISATFDMLDREAQKVQQTITDLANTAGVNLDTLASGFDPVISNVRDLISENENLARQYEQELNSIGALIAQLEALEQQYKAVYEAAMKAVQAADALRQQKTKDDDDDTSTKTTTSSATSGKGSSTSGKSNTSNKQHQKRIIMKNGIMYFLSTDKPTAKEIQYLKKMGQSYKILAMDGYQTFGSKLIRTKDSHEMKGYTASWYTFKGFKTGGYTGDWNSNEGKLAVLHQKELVLNQNDTKNILAVVEAVRKLTNNSASNLAAFLTKKEMSYETPSLNKILDKIAINQKSDNLQQNVKIEANFPDVKSADEIKNAFNNLINIASMHANSTKK